MKTLCIYHGNCADGFGAAWALRYSTGNNGKDIDFHPGIYGEAPPDVTDRNIIMLDFSYKRDVILKMAETAKSILIIDHHKTAEADLKFNHQELAEGDWCPIDVIFDMEKSGAMLSWEYFNKGKPVPGLIAHIQDRDLWEFKLNFTREIQAAVFSYEYDFKVWDRLMNMEKSDLILEGEAIERKHFKDIHEFIKVAAYRTVIAGWNVPVLNAPYFYSSDAGHILGVDEPFAACYWDTAKGRTYSLRSAENGIDVSEIAEIFGGGGHEHAAGFNVGHDDVGHVCLNAESFLKLKNGE